MTAERRLICAIYTRKSTEEGLDQNFNSLDAQRDACENFIASQKSEGWMMARERYDDGTDSIKLGKEACEACRVPAGEFEGVVVKQLRGVLRSP